MLEYEKVELYLVQLYPHRESIKYRKSYDECYKKEYVEDKYALSRLGDGK